MDIFGNFGKLVGDKKIRKSPKSLREEFDYADTVIEPIGKNESKSNFRSFLGTKAFLVLLFCVIILKLFQIQIVEGNLNENLALGNRVRPRVIEATRGLIVDRNGNWLVRNKPSFALAAYPSDLPKNKALRGAIYQKIADFTGMSFEEVRTAAEKDGLSSLDEVTIKENIPHEEALLLEEKIAGTPGVFVAKKAIREYQPAGTGLAHLLGYTGAISKQDMIKYPDYLLSERVGKSGLEAQYEGKLRGTPGVEQVEVDSKGNTVRVLVDSKNREPVPGDDLALYLDSGLQQKTAEALKGGVEAGKQLTGNEVVGGTAIVMDVKTGGILSMVSLPDFDSNLFSTKISSAEYAKLLSNKGLPMFNRSTAGTYPPGSISKIVLASAGLQEGVIDTKTALDTPSEIKIGDYVFPDWKDHGYTDIERAIAESNNIFFYAIGGGFDKIRGLGIEKIKKYWELFGLGEDTGIDLPSESAGLLPDPDWKKRTQGQPWYLGDTYHVSIGQGDLLVTPLQMLRATAAIANGGKLLNPQLVRKDVLHDGKVVQEYGPRVERENFLAPYVISAVGRGMRMAVTSGSAQNLNDLPFSVAGKTGTAQFLNNQKTHAWFTAYAPYENPEIAIIVLVEGGGGGHEIAAPIAKDILSYYFSR